MFLGLGFGAPCVFAIRHFAPTGQVWTFLGFPTYVEGPFERIGVPTATPLLIAFLALCTAEVALGVLLWTGASYAPAVSYGLLPFEFAFWIGFALLLGPPLGVARVALLLADRMVTGSASERSAPPAAGTRPVQMTYAAKVKARRRVRDVNGARTPVKPAHSDVPQQVHVIGVVRHAVNACSN